MKISHPTLTAAELAQRIDGELIGDGKILIEGLNEIHHVERGDLCFVDHPKYYEKTINSAASVILIDRRYDCPAGKALIVTATPFSVYNDLVASFQPPSTLPVATPADFPDSRDLRLGKNCYIASGVSIGHRVTIGDNCSIAANVVIGDGTVIGNDVKIQAGSVIGAESFYYKRGPEGYQPFACAGRVVLEDRVEIGPVCTLARGVSSDTRIGEGSKLDAQVQIGHDCKIGRHCLFAAQVGIAGNTQVGDWCILQGQVGVAQNVRIGPRSIVLGQSGIGKDLPGDANYFGSPAQEARVAFRELVHLRALGKREE